MRKLFLLGVLSVLIVSCDQVSSEKAESDQIATLKHAMSGEILIWRSGLSTTIGVVCRSTTNGIAIAISNKDVCDTAEMVPTERWARRYRGYTLESSYHSSLVPEAAYFSSVRFKQ